MVLSTMGVYQVQNLCNRKVPALAVLESESWNEDSKQLVTGHDVGTWSQEELKRYQPLNDRLVERALRMGGTCTGEHGIGSGKLKYMKSEHGDSLELMRQIKYAFDPHNLMNPGKVIPA